LLGILLVFELGGCDRPSSPDQFNGTWVDPAMPAPNLAVLSSNSVIDWDALSEKYLVLAFGYTACPDVCPLTMKRLSRTMTLLGEKANGVQVALVTVDPDRDSPDRLAAYAASFNPSFVGLGGSMEAIESVTAPLGIYHAVADSAGHAGAHAGYLVDHTTSTLVLEPGGGVRLLWSLETTPEEMAEDLRLLIR
jgi:protein SCO1/2